MKKKVIIVGGFQIPQGNASAVRALGTARILSEIGYDVILVGKICNSEKEKKWYTYDGFSCYDFGDMRDFPTQIDFIETIWNEIPQQSLYAIVAYNYPGIALNKLRKFAVAHNIAMISDVTEWYAFEGKNLVGAIVRKFYTEYRMLYVNKRIKNLICISTYIENYYRRYNTVLLPVLDDESFGNIQKIFVPAKENEVRHFIYAGSPGYRFKKDKIHIILKMFERLRLENIPFHFDIYGITLEEYCDFFGELQLKTPTTEIVFHGRVVRKEVLSALDHSDFCVLYRPNNRVCKVGFSTKSMEAISNGVPLVANDVNGDFQRYFTKGQALLCNAQDSDEVFFELLKKAATMPIESLNQMKRNCVEHNPFDYRNFLDSMKYFMEHLNV